MKRKVILSLIILLTVFFLFSGSVLAADEDDQYAKVPSVTLEVPFGNSGSSVQGLAGYIQLFYEFVVYIIAIAAVIMLMFGGFKWATAAGNSSMVASAKNTITNALIGLVLALTSFLLLYAINPNLVSLEKLNIPKVVLKDDVQNYCNYEKVPKSDFEKVEIKTGSGWQDVTKTYLDQKSTYCGADFKLNGAECHGDYCENKSDICVPVGDPKGVHYECKDKSYFEKSCKSLTKFVAKAANLSESASTCELVNSSFKRKDVALNGRCVWTDRNVLINLSHNITKYFIAEPNYEGCQVCSDDNLKKIAEAFPKLQNDYAKKTCSHMIGGEVVTYSCPQNISIDQIEQGICPGFVNQITGSSTYIADDILQYLDGAYADKLACLARYILENC